MTSEGGSMTSEGGSMTSEGGTKVSEGGTAFFRASLCIPRVYYDRGAIIWVLEIICSRLRCLQILSKRRPPSSSAAAEGANFQ